jgi:phage terminase small subunit
MGNIEGQRRRKPAARRATTAKPLNIRQLLFVSEYLKDFNGAAAYARAYGSRNPAACAAHAARLVADGRVKALLETGKAEKLARNALTADRVLEEYRRIAFADIRLFFDAKGNLIPITDLTEEQGSQLAGLEVIVKNAKAGDGHTDEVCKFKLWDKTRALEALAKHFGFVRARLEMSGWDKLSAQLNHARTVGPTAST